jgi:hypothetical protein
MKIVVNHLTRMTSGFMCVAGLDPDSLAQIRLTLRGERLKTDLLRRHGGPIDMAVPLNLGKPIPAPSKPEVEDHIIDPSKIEAEKTLKPDRFWELLRKVAVPKLSAIFGPDLKMRGPESCGVDVGAGQASLGCLVPATRCNLYVGEKLGGKPKARIEISDGILDVDLVVTDLRLYGGDHVTVSESIVKNVNKRLQSGVGVILSVGLTRPFPQTAPLHWLQCNNIHLEDDSTWQLG